MPFDDKGGRVEVIRYYGKQEDGTFNHGVDFKTRNFLISACADGVVCGAMNNPRGAAVLIRHADFTVEYSALKTRFVQLEHKVKAGTVVGMSGDTFRVECKYKGEEIDPMEFLTMMYGNIKMLQHTGKIDTPDLETVALNVPNDYDRHQQEIEGMMLRFLPSYFSDMAMGRYSLPTATEMSLRNIFSWAVLKKLFFRVIPHLSNPAGLDESAIPLATKVQNLLIADFLNYLAVNHQTFLSGMGDDEKKKPFY